MQASKNSSSTQTLNYYQQSPVRGQLEPLDAFSKSGWRYLQCTDTPNELRVLLPPRTALVYSHLLRAETIELAKDKSASWERIMQIRHLKDRMIRKCQRLARSSSSTNKNTGQIMMFTVHAPPDFRLKEMERWFRDQSPEFTQLVSGGSATAFCCSKCGPLGVQNAPPKRAIVAPTRPPIVDQLPQKSRNTAIATRTSISTAPRVKAREHATIERTNSKLTRTQSPHRTKATMHKRPSDASSRTVVEPESPPKYILSRADLQERTSRTASPANSVHSNRSQSRAVAQTQIPTVTQGQDVAPARERGSPASTRAASPADKGALQAAEQHPRDLKSPEPLPIPYRPRDTHEEDNANNIGPITPVVASPQMIAHEVDDLQERHEDAQQESGPADDTQYEAATSVQPDVQPFTAGQPLDTIHEKPEPPESVSGHRPLMRRRSSLKKRDSMSRMSVASQSKSVTWAMDRDWADQMSKFIRSANEADVAAYEMAELRAQYQEELDMMRIVCGDALTAAEHLGINTDLLKREQEALVEQENKVNVMTDRMKYTEDLYREKVLAVLEETKRVVTLCDKKRDQRDA